MNFQQLRIVRETVRRNFNLTEVANTLFTSQSGVSKHIKDLEDELGVELFVRRGKRLLGLTDPGKELIEIVERILVDTANIKRLGEQFSQSRAGPARHRHHPHPGPLRAAARGGGFPRGLPEGAPDAAPGQPDRDRLHAQRRRGRHRHLHRDAARRALADHLPVLQLASRRGRAARARAGEGQAADAGGDRGVADHHLSRGLHRPRQHRPDVRQGRTCAGHRHVGDGYRRAQGLRRAWAWASASSPPWRSIPSAMPASSSSTPRTCSRPTRR